MENRRVSYKNFIVIIYFVGLYTNISLLHSGEILVPSIFCGLSGLTLLILNINTIKTFDIIFLFVVFVIGFVSIYLNPWVLFEIPFYSYLNEYTLSYISYVYSIFCSFGLFLELRKWKSVHLSKLTRNFLLIVLSICFLEVYTPIDSLFKEIETILYKKDYIYEASIRDLLIYQNIRPNGLTSEPSHVGRFIILLLSIWYLISTEKYKLIKLLLFFTLSIILIRSIVIIFALIPVLYCIAFKLKSRGMSSPAFIGILIISLISIPTLFWLLTPVISGRIEHFASGNDGSTYIRIILPAQILGYVMTEWPIFGLGLGTKEAAFEISQQFWIEKSRHIALIAGNTNAIMGTNLIMVTLAQLGLLGGFLFLLSTVIYIRKNALGYLGFMIFFVISYSFTIGDLINIGAAGFFFIGLAACCIQHREALDADRCLDVSLDRPNLRKASSPD